MIWLGLALIAWIPLKVGPFPRLDDIQLTIPQVLLILNLNGVMFFLHAASWTVADDTLCDLTDVWNEVRLSLYGFLSAQG
jgi:hypothetical protein